MSPRRRTAAPPVSPDTPVPELLQVVLARWEAEDGFTPATLDKCGDLVARFVRRLTAQGITQINQITPRHSAGFVMARTGEARLPEVTTQHARRSALRMFFRSLRELGLEVADPTLDLVLTPRSGKAARPLTDAEITLCRASTRLGEAGAMSLHRAVCWALGETTAVTSEISAIRLADVDHPTQPRWIHLPGTRRHDPRLGELTDWGSAIIARQIDLLTQRHAAPGTLLAYRGTGTPGTPGAQSAVCNAIGAVLDLSGLASEPDIRPASLRNWAARSLFEGGMPIEQVARRMGTRSLDTTAADIALDWRPAS